MTQAPDELGLQLEDIPAAVWITDKSGLVLGLNSSAAGMLGFPREMLVGRSIASVTHPDDIGARAQLEALQPGHSQVSRRRMRHARGHYLLVEGRTRLDARGVLVTAVQDLTELDAAERDLAASDVQLQLITDEVPALLGYLDPEFRYLRANATYQEWFGIDVLGKTVQEVAPGSGFWERVEPNLRRALAGERVQFEAVIDYPTGRRDVTIAYIPDRPATGEVRGVIVLVTDHTASRAAERALRDSERMLAQSQRLASVGTWELDLDGVSSLAALRAERDGPSRLRWTEECARLFGYDPGAAPPPPGLLLDAMHPDDQQRTLLEMERSLRENTPAELEHLLRWPDGQWRRLHQWALLERSEGSVRLLGACQDVTERVRAESAAREAREQLQLVMDTTPAMMARCDREGRFIWVNRSYGSRMELEPEAIIGQTIRELLGEEGWSALLPHVQRVLAGETFAFESEVPYPRLGRRWIHAVYAPTWRDGAPDGWVAAVTDISERRELERALARSELRHRSLVETLASVVWTADARGEFSNPQPAWQSYTGQGWEQHRGMGWTLAIHPDDRPEVVESWLEGQRALRPVHARGRLWHAQSGQYRHFEVRAVPLTSEGQLIEWIGTIVDVHERERALEGLREADRRKDEFLAMLSHELRNPLAPIVHAVEILSRPGADAQTTERYRDVIHRQIQHFRRLLDDLLDVARVSQGRIPLRREPVDLSEVLLQAVEMSGPLLLDKGHALLQEIRPGLALEGDAARLVQVFANLLNNAARYTEAGGSVRLRAAPAQRGEQRYAHVSVEDTGVGMGPELLQKAFDLFTQADRSIDRAQGGLGIGLTLVRSLVRMHGGEIEAHSDGPGKGSRFDVWLPLRPESLEGPEPGTEPGPRPIMPSSVPRPQPRSHPPAAPVARALRILVVEDNLDGAEALAALLGMMGHEVQLAHDGPAALQLMTRQDGERPELVLLDIGLPGMDGFEVASRARRAGVRAQLVALTGYGREDDLKRSAQAGFDRHLVKPVEIDDLLGMVEAMASRAGG